MYQQVEATLLGPDGEALRVEKQRGKKRRVTRGTGCRVLPAALARTAVTWFSAVRPHHRLNALRAKAPRRVLVAPACGRLAMTEYIAQVPAPLWDWVGLVAPRLEPITSPNHRRVRAPDSLWQTGDVSSAAQELVRPLN